MVTSNLVLRIKPSPASETIAELSREIERASELLKKRTELLFNLPDFTNQLFTFEVDCSVTNAGEAFVCLNSSNSFAVLLAAIRAGEVDSLIVEYS